MEESVESDEHLEIDASDNNNGLEMNSEPANNSSILEVNLEEGSAENQQGTYMYFKINFYLTLITV